jgi:hypothetical protein
VKERRINGTAHYLHKPSWSKAEGGSTDRTIESQ